MVVLNTESLFVWAVDMGAATVVGVWVGTWEVMDDADNETKESMFTPITVGLTV